MGVCNIHFKDVTNDPAAVRRIESNGQPRYQQLRAELLALGFSPVGLLESALTSATVQVTLQTLNNLRPSPDVETLRGIMEQGPTITEILGSPDRKAFGIVDPFFGGPIVAFRTVLEHGQIIDTTMKPVRSPDARPIFFQVDEAESGEAIAAVLHGVQKNLSKIIFGNPPSWPRDNCPQAGYHLEFVEARSIELLWERHCQRIHRIRSSSIRPHNDLELFVCISRRWDKIRELKDRWEEACFWALSCVTITALTGCWMWVFYTVLTTWTEEQPDFEWLRVAEEYGDAQTVSLVIAFGIGVLVMFLITSIRERLAPWWPGTTLQPVTELLRRYSMRANGY